MLRLLRTTANIHLAGMAAAASILCALALAPACGAATAFSDGFEGGTLSAWSSVSTAGTGQATVQASAVRTGAFAAWLSSTSDPASHAFVRRTFPSTRDVTVIADLRPVSGGGAGSNVPLLRLFDANGVRVVSLYRQNEDMNRLYVQHGGRYDSTSATLPIGTWGRLELTVRAWDGAGAIVVKLDGAVILDTPTAPFGSAGVAAVQLGNEVNGQPFELAADNVLVTAPALNGGCDPAAPQPTTTDPGAVVVADNFESGLGRWTVAQNGDARVTTQSAVARGGCAARIAVTANYGSLGNLTRPLPGGTREVWADGWFNFEAEGASASWNTPTFRFFSDGRRVLDVSRQNGSARLFVRYPNGTGGSTIRSTSQFPALRRWYHVRIHAVAADNASTVEVWLDEVRIFTTTAATLGTSRLTLQMVGADHARQEGVVAVDDVVVKASA